MLGAWFESLPVRHKLILLLVLASTFSLATGSVVALLYDVQTARTVQQNRLHTLARVVGDNSRAAIEFADVETAEKTLASLRNESSVEAACLFDSSGTRFATYLLDPSYADQLPEAPPESKAVSSWWLTQVTSEIRDDDGSIGHLYVRANTEELRGAATAKLKIQGLILFAVIGMSVLAASRMQRIVSRRITHLCELTRDVQLRQDFSLRSNPGAPDEVGTLCEAFNDMLSQIELHQRRLKESNDELEQRVEQRTADLQDANQQLHDEIEGHQHAREELQLVHAELVSTARAAGMAEIATGVLHDVGNVLNSVNVTAGLLKQQATQWAQYGQGVVGVKRLLTENHKTLGPFFNQHPKGKRLIEYLGELARSMSQKNEKICHDVEKLTGLVDHIKEIVAAQQSMARVRGVQTALKLSQLFEEALMMSEASLTRHNVTIVKEFDDDPTIRSDKHRILQILVNLVSNAKHAMECIPSDQRRMTLTLKRFDDARIAASIQDSGTGITAENLDKVFQHGFTTKKHGHGFGLHASALAAQELGGALSVHSDGEGRGATFLLELPLEPPDPSEM